MSAPPRKMKAETNDERIINPIKLNFGDDDDFPTPGKTSSDFSLD